MTFFLQQLSKQLIENHKNDLNDICVILPNHRAILYLKKYLSELIDKPTWAPQIWSIEDFVFEATHLQKCENVELLLDLFTIHCNITNEKHGILDKFIQWGNMILSDFEEIDAQLVDEKKLFQYLSEEKAMELWNVDSTPLTLREKDYISFYQSLSIYYNLLKEKVLNENKAWSRLAYRVFNDKFDEYFRAYTNKSFYIAGFNALTIAEESLVKKISLNVPTKIIWDYDDYYLDKKHEAGFFIRENFKNFGKPANTVEQPFKEKKMIYCNAISNDIGQAIETCRILKESNYNPNETAIILNDESLLVQILNFLPEHIIQFNITMGYSFKNTQLYDCMNNLLDLHASLLKNENRYYYKNLFNFLQHPIFKKYLSSVYPNDYKILEQNIIQFSKSNMPYLKLENISKNIFNNIQNIYEENKILLTHWDSKLKNAIDSLEFFVKKLSICFEQDKDFLNLEYLLQVQKNINKIKSIVVKYPEITTGIQSISFIFKQIFSYISIPFLGEPLGGLQIMGLLETRLLDFKNIIMVSVNEGKIPKNTIQKTFIPFNIRKIFGLPTVVEQNSISAYHFYHAIQRAENVHLLYNSNESSGMGLNEKSRFITQLEMELPKYTDKVQIIKQNEILNSSSIKPLYAPVIQKNDKLIAALDDHAKKGFSPSAFNDYNDCTLRFYLKHILNIKSKDKLTEDIDNALLGTITHRAIELLHTKYLNQVLTKDILDLISQEVDARLEESFYENLNNRDFKTGYNYLLFHAAKKLIIRFIKKESEYIKDNYVILFQEHKLNRTLEVLIKGAKKDILIKGVADRISSNEHSINIVDFKSGKVDNADVSINNFNDYIETLYNTKQKPKAFQLLTYFWLYSVENKTTKPIKPVIISLQKGSNEFALKFDNDSNITTEMLESFEGLLNKIISEMYDTSIPFKATDDSKKCEFCDFIELCRWKNPKNQLINED